MRAGSRALAVAALVLGARAASAQPPPGAGTRQGPQGQPGQGQQGQGKQGQGQIEAGKLSKVPKQTKFVEAEYPKDAFDKGIEADVVLLLDIGADGKVESVGIAQPADPPGMGFDEAAMAAAQEWLFTPAELDGKAIAVQITYRYHFTIKNRAEAVPPAEPAPGAGTAEKPAGPARQPAVNFSGVLVERGTRLPLAGVVVTVFRDDGGQETEKPREKAPAPGPSPSAGGQPSGFEASTDATGRFTFYDLSPGRWKVVAEPPGYYPYRTTESIASGLRVNATYYVEKASYNPYDVTVTASRPRKEVSRTVISAAELDKVPGGFGDPVNVVQNFAGVARNLQGLLIVRGSAPEDSMFMLDGMEIPNIYHFGGLKSVFPVSIMDAIEFYPGNFSTMYGRRTGGVVDIRLKELKPRKVGGYADVSLIDTGVFLEAPLGNKGGIAVAGRRSYIDGVLNLAVPSDAPVSLETAPVYYDAHLLANYRPTPAHDLRSYFLFSDDRLKLLFDNPADIDPEFTGNTIRNSTTFYRGLLTYHYVPGESFENTVRVSAGRDKFFIAGGQLLLDYSIGSAQLRNTTTVHLGKPLALSVGADVEFTQTDAHIALPPPPDEGTPQNDFDIDDILRTDIENQNDFYPGAFLEAEVRPFEGLLLLPGVRIDHFGRTDETIVQPRATARWTLSPRWTVKGGVGLFVEEPQIHETSDVFGNPDLDNERALHVSAGVEYKPLSFLTLDVTGFYKNLWHLVSPTDRLVMDGDSDTMEPLQYDNGGTGEVWGGELVVRHEFNANLTGWLTYTLSRAERLDTDATEKRLFDFDQTHILNLTASYLLPRNWEVGARFRLVSGNPNTPIVGAVYNASEDRYDPTYGEANTGRDRTFQQLDLRIDKRWIYRNWIFNAYLDIQNVYNYDNAEGVSYNYDYTESEPNSGLPLLTVFGLKAEF
ncbi:MAG TPA: TonB family protein [Kofleriaceae bacterium]|nr:TonB family protein [Kofleriaceae bacterium]